MTKLTNQIFGSKLLYDSTTDNINRVISRDFPDLDLAEIKLIGAGSDCIAYMVNNHFVCKIPKKSISKLNQEIRVLKLIHESVSTKTPNVSHVGKKYGYILYPMIFGEDLYSSSFRRSSSSDKDALAQDVAGFLYDLHHNVSIADARLLGVMNNEKDVFDVEELFLLVEKKIVASSVKNYLYDVLNKYRTTEHNLNDVVLHHDLCNANIIINPTAIRLNGVIDFGDVAIGDRYIDFSSLYRRNPLFAMKVAKYYSGYGKVTIYESKVHVYAVTKEITKLKYGLEGNEESTLIYRSAIKRLTNWSKGKSVECIPT